MANNEPRLPAQAGFITVSEEVVTNHQCCGCSSCESKLRQAQIRDFDSDTAGFVVCTVGQSSTETSVYSLSV